MFTYGAWAESVANTNANAQGQTVTAAVQDFSLKVFPLNILHLWANQLLASVGD